MYVIVHSVSGDRATAEDEQGMKTAVRTLHREASEHGQRGECLVVRLEVEDEERGE